MMLVLSLQDSALGYAIAVRLARVGSGFFLPDFY